MARLSRPVHLYVKTHRKTGLKYFGRTVEDPFVYKGSGAYWTRHIERYSNDVSTVVVGTYEDEGELRSCARNFSAVNEVATSTDWANLLPEDGGTAGEGWNPTQTYAARFAALDEAVERRMRLSGARSTSAGQGTVAVNYSSRENESKWARWIVGLSVSAFAVWGVSSFVQMNEAKDAESHPQSLGSVTCNEQSRDCWDDAVTRVIDDLRDTDLALWKNCHGSAWDAFTDAWAGGVAGTPPNGQGSATAQSGRCEVKVVLSPGVVTGEFTKPPAQ